MRLPRVSRQECELAEKIAAPEPDFCVAEVDLAGAGGDEPGGVAALALDDQMLAGNGEGGPHQSAEVVDLGPGKALEQRHALDQRPRVELHVEARRRSARAR